jgi:hypothetical protein
MAESNGSGKRFDDIEDAIRSLIEHADLSDKRIEGLTAAVTATNENVIHLSGAVENLGSTVKDLLTGLRELIDRIPPENLR